MILISTKFGGNRTKDVEVGPDRQADSYIPPPPNYVCGGYNKIMGKFITIIITLTATLSWFFTIYSLLQVLPLEGDHLPSLSHVMLVVLPSEC